MPYLDEYGNHIVPNQQQQNPYSGFATNSYKPTASPYANVANPPTASTSPYGSIVNYLRKPKALDNPYEAPTPEPSFPGAPSVPTPPTNPTNPVTVPKNPNPPPMSADNPPQGPPRGSGPRPTTPINPLPDPYGTGGNKPAGTEDPAIAARWYATQPGYGAVTTADVVAYRSSNNSNGMTFQQWWDSGNRAENQNWNARFGPNGSEVMGSPQSGLGQPVDDAAARYWRRQWYLENIQGTNLDPNDPKNFVGGQVFDQYGQLVQPKTGSAVPEEPPYVPPGAGSGGSGAAPAPTGGAGVPGANGGSGNGSGAQAQGQSIADQLRSLLQPEFSYEQEQLNRGLNANAAVTGDINSGGFGETVGRAQAQLAGNQGQRMSDYLATASENEKNRGVQREQIDAQKFIASMQDETQRLGIKTNDQLQRWLNDPNNNTLNKYQIDKNDFLQRYQADLQLRGQEYSANAQVSAASMQAAATSSAAARNQQTQLQIARINAGLEQQQIENSYNLNLGGQAWDQYKYTHPSFTDILNAYLKFTPEQIAAMGLPPLTTIYGP